MKSYKIAASTKTGKYIETEQTGTNMLSAIEGFIYSLAIDHQTVFDDVVELDVTELP